MDPGLLVLIVPLCLVVGGLIGLFIKNQLNACLKKAEKLKKVGKIDFPGIMVCGIERRAPLPYKIYSYGRDPTVTVVSGKGGDINYYYVVEMDLKTIMEAAKMTIHSISSGGILDFLLNLYVLSHVSVLQKENFTDTHSIEIPVDEADFNKDMIYNTPVIVHWNPFDPDDKPTFTWNE